MNGGGPARAPQPPPGEWRSFVATATDRGERLDRFLAARLPEVSRARLQELIRSGQALIDAAPRRRPAERLRGGETITIAAGAHVVPALSPAPLAFGVLYEDEDFAVIDKPAGLTVHPGAGKTEAARMTLVHGLLHRFPTLSQIGAPNRPGIVHRLDRLTSGLMLVAKTDISHRNLAAQFQARSVEKYYIGLAQGRLPTDAGRLDAPIQRDPRHRARMTAHAGSGIRGGRAALTQFTVLQRLSEAVAARGTLGRAGRGNGYTLLRLRTFTGRTHQIRAHLSGIGHPLVGDRLYGAAARWPGPADVSTPPARIFLHAAELRLAHPRSGASLAFQSPLPAELAGLLDYLRALASAAQRQAGENV